MFWAIKIGQIGPNRPLCRPNNSSPSNTVIAYRQIIILLFTFRVIASNQLNVVNEIY